MTIGQNEAAENYVQSGSAAQPGTGAQPERRLSPADLHNVRFTRAPMMHPGYVDSEVDRVMSRAAEELDRLMAEKAALRDQVRSLQAQVDGIQIPEPPSEQALRILSSAQLTADNYVAEAEEFSRQVTAEARAQYEELTRQARENAGGILQAAQEAAAKIGTSLAPVPGIERSAEELEEQVAYLKAFGQACRAQLRAYLEALLSDVESEWGKADPGALPHDLPRPPAQRSGSEDGAARTTTFEANTAVETQLDDVVEEVGPLPSVPGRAG
jgi:DivIVA domain-containing protein